MHDDRHAPELNQHAPLEKLLNRSKHQFPHFDRPSSRRILSSYNKKGKDLNLIKHGIKKCLLRFFLIGQFPLAATCGPHVSNDFEIVYKTDKFHF